jgi:hypothetical protein
MGKQPLIVKPPNLELTTLNSHSQSHQRVDFPEKICSTLGSISNCDNTPTEYDSTKVLLEKPQRSLAR